MKKDKTEKPNTLSSREAAQDFVRPYVLKGDIMPLRPFLGLRHDTEQYSARIEGENVLITMLHGKEIKEQFPVSDIIRDVAMEHSYGKGIADITADTAQDAYEIRAAEIKILLKELHLKFKEHKGRFKKNPTNWGYVGDMGHVYKKLREIIASMQ